MLNNENEVLLMLQELINNAVYSESAFCPPIRNPYNRVTE